MQKLNDLSRSLTPLKPDGTLIAVKSLTAFCSNRSSRQPTTLRFQL